MGVTSRNTPDSLTLDACCNGPECADNKRVPVNTAASTLRDIEKNRFVTEHVKLSIEGMTCVGCEKKLFSSLNAIPGIQNLQTSLVMAIAEFDFNAATVSINGVIRDIAKTTGFSCQEVHTQGQSLDVLVSCDARDFVRQKNPYGVQTMVAVDKHTVHITYDAKLIGARDLLQRSFDAPIALAPHRPHAELESGSKHVRQTALITAFSTVVTISVLVLAWAPLPRHEILYGSISLALATIVQIVVAGPFYPSAFKALIFTRVIEMDLLIVLSTSTAYIYSVVAFSYAVQGRPLPTGEFFETSTCL